MLVTDRIHPSGRARISNPSKMPWLETSLPDGEAAKSWHALFKNAFTRRLSVERLAGPLKAQHSQHTVRPTDLANILLGFRASPGSTDDPLLFIYVDFLLKTRYITERDVLLALLDHSEYDVKRMEPQAPERPSHLPSCEERIFTMLTQKHMSSPVPASALEIQNLIFSIYRWLKMISEHEMAKQLEGGGLHAIDQRTYGMYEALGSLAISILGNNGIRVLCKQKWWKERRAAVVEEMESYDTHVLQWMQSQLAGRLRALCGLPPFIKLDDDGRPIFTDQQIVDAVPEVPVVHSRAGFFIWLNAAFTARPLTDDMTILSYLNARFSGDAQSQVVDLLVASFDVLTNALLRKESLHNVAIRSFICNKVPTLISMLSGSIAPPMTAEACIQMALGPGGMVSVDPLPPITSGAAEVREALKSARLDFLQACALHSLVSESTVGAILQENVALPRVVKYSKDSLAAQCINNVSRLEALVGELTGMQGNAGPISGCIVETIGSLCMNKDTMSLKTVCNELVKKVPSMDIVMQYAQPSILLLPLCNLLNDWVHDQDQTEFTPSYEEFASILLLTLAVIHRYDLHWSEIGLLPDTFISRLLDNLSVSKPPSELSSEQASQLAQWIEGLFAVDEHGETSGIGDDVMRQCSPQAFYELVPSLFEQSVLACRSKALTMKVFKGGLELLLEPFLLPSLVMSLGWLAKHSWEDHNDTKIILQILDKLLKPSSSSQDTQGMHRAILAMVAIPLSESLQTLLQKHPEEKKATELSDIVSRYLNSQRVLTCRKEDLDQWLQLDRSLEDRMRRTMRDLTAWAATSSNPSNPPPSFTYKEFAVACKLVDPNTLLQALVDELTRMQNLPVAIDVCTALICAPTRLAMALPQHMHSVGATEGLRRTVRLVASDMQNLLQKRQSEAETLVRLNRRVEAQLAVAQLPPMVMPIQMTDQTADQMMQDLGLDLNGDTATAAVDTAMTQEANLASLEQTLHLSAPTEQELASMAAEQNSMDMDQMDLTFDMGPSMQNEQSMNMQNQEEDIFADLGGISDFGDDFNFG